MGLRTRIKSIIKKAIGQEENPIVTTPPSVPPVPPAEPVAAPIQPTPIENIDTEQPAEEAPKPEEVSKEKEETNQPVLQTKDALDPEPSTTTESSPDVQNETPINDDIEEPQDATEAPAEDSDKENGSEPQAEISADAEGAVAVFKIKRLFDEKCPSCGDSTYNNWAYVDSAFICQSCEASL